MNTDLTHPEILTIEQLQFHLKKFFGTDNITNDKYELIELFYKYITPLPQRKFRANRLGTILTNNQKQQQGQKRSLSTDLQVVEKSYTSKFKSSTNELPGEKHESDRGIYTIKMQGAANKNTTPIKLKRPSISPTITAGDDQETCKRIKLDEAHV